MNDEISLKDRLLGIGTEVGTGIGTDVATSGLLAGGPLGWLAYAGINFGSGAYTNYLVQKHLYGQDNVNWGEIIASGAMGMIPFMDVKVGKLAGLVGKTGTVQRGIVGGALTGLGGEQLRVGIDEQRFLSPLETVVSAGVGGGLGGGLTRLTQRRNFIPEFDPTGNQIQTDTVTQVSQKLGVDPEVALQQQGLKHRILKHNGGEFESEFVPPTYKEVADMKQTLMDNQLANADGRLNIWAWFDNKKIATDNWARSMSKDIQSLPFTRTPWKTAKDDLQNDFLRIYPESLLKKIKIKNKKGEWRSLTKSSIEIEHIVTLQQSMPLFADLVWGGTEWQAVMKRILSKQFASGDNLKNFIAVPEHIHNIKTQYFNALSGHSGRTFFTDKIIRDMIDDSSYRMNMVDEWLKHVQKGKKIIDDGLKIWETLYVGKPLPYMPEELVEQLTDIDLETKDIRKILQQLFDDFDKSNFGVDSWNRQQLQADEKAAQLIIDNRQRERTLKALDQYYNTKLNKFKKPYRGGMKSIDLFEKAEKEYRTIRSNRNLREDLQLDWIKDPEDEKRVIERIMENILYQVERNQLKRTDK